MLAKSLQQPRQQNRTPKRLLLPPFVIALASADRHSENVSVKSVVVSELKLRDVQRHIFGADFVEAADNPALEDRPKTF